MSDTVFRSAPDLSSAAQPTFEAPKANTVGHDSVADIEPRSIGDGSVLQAMGIADDPKILSEGDRANMNEIDNYITDLLEGKGLSRTMPNIKKTLDGLREDIGLEAESDPMVVFERLGGVLKSWKNISFIKDPGEKRALFMRLSRAKTSSEMNRLIFKEMESRKVWQ